MTIENVLVDTAAGTGAPTMKAPARRKWNSGRAPGMIVEVKGNTTARMLSNGGRNLRQNTQVEDPRVREFEKRLKEETVYLGHGRDEGLKCLAWGGIPMRLRGECWKILSGYSPAACSRRLKELTRKRKEYLGYVRQYFASDAAANDQERVMRHQIEVDVPRTLHEHCIFQTEFVQRAMERILYIWSIRHPASGYVQGINDLTTPFLAVFISEYLDLNKLLSSPTHECEEQLSTLPEESLQAIEADTFWGLSNLLRYVQDNYTFAQPGIQQMVLKVKNVIRKLDPELSAHFDEHELKFTHFTFRWMNCLLVRELPLHIVIRLWDTYMAEAEGYPALHVYVCVAFLLHWSKDLISMDFAEMLSFLQSLSKRHVYLKDLEQWISHAYVLQHMFEDSGHLSVSLDEVADGDMI